MDKQISNTDLYTLNTVAIKIVPQKREYSATTGSKIIVKDIERQKYLKICWNCGEPYESYKSSSFACRVRCSQNINRRRKQGLNPFANMSILTKERNTKEIREQFGYR